MHAEFELQARKGGVVQGNGGRGHATFTTCRLKRTQQVCHQCHGMPNLANLFSNNFKYLNVFVLRSRKIYCGAWPLWRLNILNKGLKCKLPNPNNHLSIRIMEIGSGDETKQHSKVKGCFKSYLFLKVPCLNP